MTQSGQVLDAKQTAHAAAVNELIWDADPAAPPFPGAWAIWSLLNNWTPAESYARGSELVL